VKARAYVKLVDPENLILRDEAGAMLAKIYSWFTEGFDSLF
jgi:hypothetical protein